MLHDPNDTLPLEVKMCLLDPLKTRKELGILNILDIQNLRQLTVRKFTL